MRWRVSQLYIVEVGAGLGKLASWSRASCWLRRVLSRNVQWQGSFQVRDDSLRAHLALGDARPSLFDLGVLDSAIIDASVPGLGGEIRLTTW